MLLGLSNGYAQVVFDGSMVPIIDKCELFEDTTGRLMINEIQKVRFRDPIPISRYQEQINPHSNVWLRFKLVNKTEDPVILFKDFTFVHYMAVYVEKDTGFVCKERNDYAPFYEKEYYHSVCQVVLNAPQFDTLSCYVMLRSKKMWNPQLFVQSTTGMLTYLSDRDFVMGIFIGILLMMFLANLSLSIWLKDSSHILYTMYIFCIGIMVLSENGYAHQYLWPENQFFQEYGLMWFAAFGLIFATFFIHSFLNIDSYVWGKQTKSFAVFITMLPIVLSMYLDSYYIFKLNFAVLFIVLIYNYGVTAYVFFKGDQLAKFIFWGWTALFLSFFLNYLQSVGYIGFQVIHINMFSFSFELLFFLMALLDKMNRIQNSANQSISKLNSVLATKRSDLELRAWGKTKDLNQVLEKQELLIQERTQGLQELNVKMETINEQISLFSMFASHYLRSPVTNLLSLATIIGEKGMASSDLITFREMIKSSSWQLDHIARLLNLVVDLEYSYTKPTEKTQVAELVHVLHQGDETIKYELEDHNRFTVECNRHILDLLVKVLKYKIVSLKMKVPYDDIKIILDDVDNSILIKCVTESDSYDEKKLNPLPNGVHYQQQDIEYMVMNILANFSNTLLSHYVESNHNWYFKVRFNS